MSDTPPVDDGCHSPLSLIRCDDCGLWFDVDIEGGVEHDPDLNGPRCADCEDTENMPVLGDPKQGEQP